MNLDSSSIFSSVVFDQTNALFISTLGGNLFKLNGDTADIIWKYELDKAVFTTPVLNQRNKLLYIGTCGATFYCLTFDSELVKIAKNKKYSLGLIIIKLEL